MYIYAIVGGQFGSEAKGHVTWQILQSLVERNGLAPEDVICVRVAGPNAGHTAIGMDGIYYAFRQLPMSTLLPGFHSAIAAGSEVDMRILIVELDQAIGQGFNPNRLIIDPEVTLLRDADYDHEATERMVERIGSTGKGIGAARVARLMRQPGRRLADNRDAMILLHERGVRVQQVESSYHEHKAVVIEGTQGFGLGLRAGYYPYCTSSDCRTVDFMSMAGITPKYGDTVVPIVVLRPYPIRVAGNSGPLKGETSWEALGLPPEFTTVTKKMRRVGSWDPTLALRAIYANGGPSMAKVAVTMLDQIDHGVKFTTETAKVVESPDVWAFLKRVHRDVGGARTILATTGPCTAVWL